MMYSTDVRNVSKIFIVSILCRIQEKLLRFIYYLFIFIIIIISQKAVSVYRSTLVYKSSSNFHQTNFKTQTSPKL